MSKVAAAFWVLLVLASGFTTFTVKYTVQGIEEQLYRVRKQTIAEQQEIRVLTAEWAYLNKPERLADLNRRFLGLVPVTPHQLEGRIDQVAFRAPAVPPVLPATMVASAAAVAPVLASSAMPAIPSAPVGPAVAAAADPPAAPAAAAASPSMAGRSDALDVLIARIEANGGEPPTPADAAQGAAPRTAHAALHTPLEALLTLIEPAAASAAPIAAAPPKPPLRLAKVGPPRSLSALIARVAGKP